jgi:hypothetical protein
VSEENDDEGDTARPGCIRELRVVRVDSIARSEAGVASSGDGARGS